MFDVQKIRIMAKLAVYDKNNFSRDNKKDQYFRHDYIYKQNMWTRFSVFIGCIIVILFYAMHKIVIDNVDIFTLDYRMEISKALVFVIGVMVAYTVIGTVIYTRDFVKTQSHINTYFKLVNQLEKRNESKSKQVQSRRRTKAANEQEVTEERYGADIYDQRSDS